LWLLIDVRICSGLPPSPYASVLLALLFLCFDHGIIGRAPVAMILLKARITVIYKRISPRQGAGGRSPYREYLVLCKYSDSLAALWTASFHVFVVCELLTCLLSYRETGAGGAA
jgi:hypothetical protein